jgi:excisionase family DNA binding protein
MDGSGLKDERLITIAEASHLLAVSQVTLRRWIRGGLVPSVRLGRIRRVRVGDVAALTRVGLHGRRPAGRPR